MFGFTWKQTQLNAKRTGYPSKQLYQCSLCWINCPLGKKCRYGRCFGDFSFLVGHCPNCFCIFVVTSRYGWALSDSFMQLRFFGKQAFQTNHVGTCTALCWFVFQLVKQQTEEKKVQVSDNELRMRRDVAASRKRDCDGPDIYCRKLFAERHETIEDHLSVLSPQKLNSSSQPWCGLQTLLLISWCCCRLRGTYHNREEKAFFFVRHESCIFPKKDVCDTRACMLKLILAKLWWCPAVSFFGVSLRQFLCDLDSNPSQWDTDLQGLLFIFWSFWGSVNGVQLSPHHSKSIFFETLDNSNQI